MQFFQWLVTSNLYIKSNCITWEYIVYSKITIEDLLKKCWNVLMFDFLRLKYHVSIKYLSRVMKNEGLSDIEMAFVIYTSRLLKLLIYYLKLAYPLIKLKPRLMFDIHRGKTANNFYYILFSAIYPLLSNYNVWQIYIINL